MLFIIISNFQSILVADEQSVLEQSTETGLSLALGIISSYLEDKGIQVMMSDLNKQFGSYHFSEEQIRSISDVYNGRQVHEYLEGASDSNLDLVAELFLEDVSMDSDAFGISIGADFSLMQIHFGLLFKKDNWQESLCWRKQYFLSVHIQRFLS